MADDVPNEILCVHAGLRTAACVIHWGAWLPLETDYAAEIAALRLIGRRLMQVTNLHGNGDRRLLLELMRMIVRQAELRGITDIVAAVAPGRAISYEALRFEDLLSGVRTWSLARDESGRLNPVRVLRLALDRIPPQARDRFFNGMLGGQSKTDVQVLGLRHQSG